MLKSEAFRGQLVKITCGAYKGSIGIIFNTSCNTAVVVIAVKETKEDWERLYYVAYADMKPFFNVTLDANDNNHTEDASTSNTKYYDEHYASMVGLEPIELMQYVLSPAELVGFLKGNIIKYSMRAGKKQGEAAEKDTAKAKRYVQWLHKANPYDPQFLINPKED